MKIKTEKVKRPYTLSGLANHFGFNQARLKLKLRCLAEDGELYKFDIRKIKGGDYQLCTFAASVLVFETDQTSQTLYKLADLVEKEKDNTSKRYSREMLLYQCKVLSTQLESTRLNAELNKNRKFIADHNRTLDGIINFTDPCSPSSN